MLRMERNIPVGTMAFTLITKALYLRVSQGCRSTSVRDNIVGWIIPN